GVEPERVVTAAGTSMANHLVFATLVQAGDEILLERPAYEPLDALARWLGATVHPFDRRAEDGFRVDPNAIAREVGPRTRLIVLTNLHNPSNVLCDDATLREVGAIARAAGAHVLVDEVYLDAVWDGRPSTAARLGPEFVVTSSLSKVYGLSGLRCGWILAEPSLARRIWRLTELFDNHSPLVAQQLSVIALGELPRLAERARALVETNRALANRFFDGRSDLEGVRPGFGTVVFLRWKRGHADRLCALLRERYQTSVVPGSFFGLPDHFRIGLGCDTALFAEGLVRLGAALDELEHAAPE